jgi:predicted RNA-binding Zn ribbon-like protein
MRPERKHTEEDVTFAELRLLGGRLCLDFANTVDPRHGEHPHEFLAGYADLARWARHAGAVGPRDAHRLLDQAQRHPADADTTFRAARTLRDQLYRIFSSAAAGSTPDPDDLEALNRAHASAMTHARLVPSAGGFRWDWDEDPSRLDRMLWPVARDAADLLATGRLERIRECPGADGCGWLFYDTSRSGKRRWCSMEACGNRAKGRRHYQRQRLQVTEPTRHT